uniref:Uncharacterized protein n=1 Tax=Arundo donax TaxID=35708 RepID=A0A0A9BTV9_ARUDO
MAWRSFSKNSFKEDKGLIKKMDAKFEKRRESRIKVKF